MNRARIIKVLKVVRDSSRLNVNLPLKVSGLSSSSVEAAVTEAIRRNYLKVIESVGDSPTKVRLMTKGRTLLEDEDEEDD